MRILLLFLLSTLAIRAQVISTTVAVNTNMVLLGRSTNFFRANLNYADLPNMAALRALSTTTLTDGAGVNVLGYYTPGDGGGGTYVLTNSITGTNAYGGKVVALGGVKSWKLIPYEGKLNVRQFGAVGDDSTDDTASIQAAIDYSSANSTGSSNLLPLYFDTGSFVISSVYMTNAVSWYGLHEKSSGKLPLRTGSRLIHKVGATNHMINFTSTDGGQPATPLFEGFDMFGHREQNLKNPITISAVASRTLFTVPTANLPTAPSSPTSYPYYGYCFFYSDESRYIGSGLVTNINYGTGEIELVAETDLYATPTATTTLPVGYKVCFSNTSSELSGFASSSAVDGSSAGYAALNFTGTDASTIIAESVVRDCRIRFFHVGIRVGNCIFFTFENLAANCNTFAAIASVVPGDHRDSLFQHCLFQGFYSTDPGLSPEVNTYDQSLYRATLFGIYGISSSGNHTDITFDHFVHALMIKNSQETKIGQLLIDNAAHDAIILGGGTLSSQRMQTEFTSLIARNGNSGGVGLYPSYVFTALGAQNSFQINDLSVVAFGTDRYFSDVFNLPSASMTASSVGVLHNAAGATNSSLYSANTTHYPIIYDWRIDQTRMNKMIGGVNTFTWTPTGNKSYVSLFTGPTNFTKNSFYSSGFTGIDSAGMFFIFGADDATGNARTDLTAKTAYLRFYNYTNAAPGFTSIGGRSSSSANTLNIGGGDSTAEPATTLNFFTGAKTTGTGTKALEVTAGGSVNVLVADLSISTVGKGLNIKEGTDARSGVSAAMTAGSIVISTTAVTANSRIQLTPQTLGTVLRPAAVGVTARTPGTSFTITSSDATDTSTVAWVIIEPAL